MLGFFFTLLIFSEPNEAASSEGEEADEEDASGSEIDSEELSGSEGSLVEDDDDASIAETDEEMDEADLLDMTPPPSGKRAKPKAKPKKRRGGVRFDDTDSEDEEDLHLTDSEETDIPDKVFVPRKRPLFRSMNFFLYGDFPDAEKATLTKTIETLAGTVHDSNDETITHCVTTADWCPEFEEVRTILLHSSSSQIAPLSNTNIHCFNLNLFISSKKNLNF